MAHELPMDASVGCDTGPTIVFRMWETYSLNGSDRLLEAMISAAEEHLTQMEAGLEALAAGALGAQAPEEAGTGTPVMTTDSSKLGNPQQERSATVAEPHVGGAHPRRREQRRRLVAGMQSCLDQLQRRVSAFKEGRGEANHSGGQTTDRPGEGC